MSSGTVLIRLTNLAWSANASDIRRFFNGLAIPEGGVHIVGGERGDAFVTFTSDETARLALLLDGQELCGQTLKLFVSSTAEMQHVVHQARLAVVAPAEELQPPTTPTPPLLREQEPLKRSSAASAEYMDKDYVRADARAYSRQRHYPESYPRRLGTDNGGRPPRVLPPDTAVAAYDDSVPPEKRQRLESRANESGGYGSGGAYRRFYADQHHQQQSSWHQQGDDYNSNSYDADAGGFDDQHRQPYREQRQRDDQHQTSLDPGDVGGSDFDYTYHSSRRWDANSNAGEGDYRRVHSGGGGDWGEEYPREGGDGGGYERGGRSAAQNAYSNIYSGRDNSSEPGQPSKPPPSSTSAPSAYSSSRDPRLAGRYREAASAEATAAAPQTEIEAIEQSSARSSFYNEQRDPRFKGELYGAGVRRRPDELGESREPEMLAKQPPIGSPMKGSDWSGAERYPSGSGRGRDRVHHEAEDDGGYEYYSREHGPQRGRYPSHRGSGGGRGWYPPRPFEEHRGGGDRGGGYPPVAAEADYEGGGRRPPPSMRQFGDNYHESERGDYESMGAARGGHPAQRRGTDRAEFHERGGGHGFRGRSRGYGAGGHGGPTNGYEGCDSYEGSYRPKPWLSGAGGGGGVRGDGPQLLPQPPVGDDQSVVAAFKRLLHPGRPKSLLGQPSQPRPVGPLHPSRRPEVQAGHARNGALADSTTEAAASTREAQSAQPWQPPPMPELPTESLPDYVRGSRDEHFVALAGLPLDADYSDACAALPGIRLALSDVKFESDALGRRTGQAFVRLAEPADVLRALSQSGTDEGNGSVRVSASCEHEFRCANDPDFAGDEDDPDIGGGCGGVDFPARPSPYYLDCCLEVNGLPQPIVAEDLLTVFGDDRSIADPAEDLHLDRSKDPLSVTAYLRFDGFERFAEATRRDVTQLAPGAYLAAISRLQFASYRATSQRCEAAAAADKPPDNQADDDDNDDDGIEGRSSRGIDFRRPPDGFQQQGAAKLQQQQPTMKSKKQQLQKRQEKAMD